MKRPVDVLYQITCLEHNLPVYFAMPPELCVQSIRTDLELIRAMIEALPNEPGQD